MLDADALPADAAVLLADADALADDTEADALLAAADDDPLPPQPTKAPAASTPHTITAKKPAVAFFIFDSFPLLAPYPS